jgi:hypothetical protein
MRQRAVGERRGGRLHARPADAEDRALAAGAVLLCMGDDHPAPRQLGTVADGRHTIDDAVLGALHDNVRQVLVAQSCRVGGEPLGLVRGLLLGSGGRGLGRCRVPPSTAGTSGAAPAALAICLRNVRRPGLSPLALVTCESSRVIGGFAACSF